MEFFGLTPQDFIRSVTLALDKCSYPDLGFTLEEADHLTTFHGTLEEILSGSDLLLLPYCAKQPECEYRFREGCDQCGACTIGEAYALAGEQGLTVKTIQNYEHLVEELTQEKKAGTRGYIGCCCDAFQLKRQEAFKKAGLPGLLLDIENTTCYELKQEEQAYRGSFETQTHLRLDLLKKVLAARERFRQVPDRRPGGGPEVSDPRTCDVLVVGAGPAGSAAARAAARQGVSVLLAERRRRVGVPVRCAEYVPLPVGKYLDLSSPAITVQPVRAMRTFLPGGTRRRTFSPGS